MGLFRIIAGLFNPQRLMRYMLAPFKRMSFVMSSVAAYQCEATVRELQMGSPKATGLLSRSWSVKSTVSTVNGLAVAQVRVTNTAPNAIFRVAGRAPGKMPPVSAIRNWCAVKGIPLEAAFPIARSIGLMGTMRWQMGAAGNVLNYDPLTLTYLTPNPWSTTIARIEQALMI